MTTSRALLIAILGLASIQPPALRAQQPPGPASAGPSSASTSPDVDPAALAEIAASFEKLNAATSYRTTVIMPEIPPQEMGGDEVEVEMLPLMMERSGDLVRMSMSARGEEMEFTIESVVGPESYATRMLSPQMEEAFAQMGDMPGGMPGGMPGMAGLPGPLGALGGVPGVSNVVGGALGKVPGLSGVMSSPIFSVGMGLLTGGLTPTSLITQGLSLAQGMMAPGGLLGGAMNSMMGGMKRPGEWQCRTFEEDREILERHGDETTADAEAASDETAPLERGPEALTRVARLGEATLDGETFQAYTLAMEQEGREETAVEVTLYTAGPGGLPRRMELLSPELDDAVVMEYGDFDAVSVAFPECD